MSSHLRWFFRPFGAFSIHGAAGVDRLGWLLWFVMYGNDAVFKCRFSQADLLDVYFSDEKNIEDEYFVEKNDTNIGHHRAIVSEELIRGYYGEIQDFMECLRDGREPVSGFRIAKEAAELAQAAYLAAEQDRTIRL